MVGGLCVIGGTDIVASLVPEAYEWNFRDEQSDCSSQLKSLYTIPLRRSSVNHGGHSIRRAKRRETRSGGDSQRMGLGTARAGRVSGEGGSGRVGDVDHSRQEDLVRVGRDAQGPASLVVRSRLCATEISFGQPKRKSRLGVRVPMMIMVFDISVAFFHGKVRRTIYVVPPKDLRKDRRDSETAQNQVLLP